MKPTLDTSSAEPVLFYTGPRVVRDVPAADLSANALARIAWVRAGMPATVSPAVIAALRDELVATGAYATAKKSTEEPS